MSDKEAKKKSKEVAPLIPEGIVFYADAGVKPNPGFGGWGIHGYVYSKTEPKKGSGNPYAVPTFEGYVMKSEAKNAKPVEITPMAYIDGLGSMPNITNNAGELIAAYQALRYTANLDVKEVKVITDSKYVVTGATEYLHKWQNNNWLKGDGTAPSNLEHWQNLSDALNALNDKKIAYQFEWIKGHNGHLGNTVVDKYATMGRMIALDRENHNSIVSSPAEGYWGEMHERHPFLHHPCSYLTTAMAASITGEYYLGFHGKEDEVVGKRKADGAYAYVILKEQDPLLELSKRRVLSYAERDDSLVMCLLDKLYERDTANRLMRFGEECLHRPNKRLLSLNIGEANSKEEPVVVELYPPRIAIRTIEALNMLKGLLLDWRDNKESELVSTDITDLFYEKDPKGVLRFKSQYAVGFTELKTKAKYRQGTQILDSDVTLTIGMDVPERNALKKLEKADPKITLVTWREGQQALRYATIVESQGNIGIWAGYYSNLIYLK